MRPAASKQGGGVGEALAGDIGGGAVHGLEDRGFLADVGAGGGAEAADEAGDQVGEDVAEQVGGDDDVELPGVQDELHGAGIDDALIAFDAALVFLGDVFAGFEEDPG